MLIVIPGALPAPSVAAELARRLPQQAPTLHAWLQAGAGRAEPFDVREQGCTPYEAWLLQQAGYASQEGLPWGAGLGPLLAAGAAAPGGADPGTASAAEPVWLGELVHLALGTDQAMLLDPSDMDLRAGEAAALYETALPLFEGTGFAAQPLGPQRWRLHLPEGLRPATASPRAVASGSLEGWWQHDAATRPWRRLLNEIQMAWHEHPVNEARAARGVAPVNGVWLYGGASPWPRRAAAAAQVLAELEAPHRAGDWAAWLDALAALDATRLKPLAGRGGIPPGRTELLLLGDDRLARLSLEPRTGLLSWLPARKHDWNAWWSRPV